MQHLQGIVVDTARLAIWLVLLAVLFVPLERWFALHESRLRRRERWADIGYYFLSSLVPGALLAVPLGVVAWGTHALMPYTLTAAIAGLPFAMKAGLAFLVGEVGFYWGHRWSHEIPLLWRFHSVHHSPEHMDFLVNTRTHPVDMVFTRLCGLVPITVLGLGGPSAAQGGSLVPVLIVLFGTVWGFFIHANVRWRLGPLEWLVATPAFHHWHHVRTGPIDRNYASTLPWLDRLFGTLHLPREWPDRYGIVASMPSGFAASLLHPFRRPTQAGGQADELARDQAGPVTERLAVDA